MADDEDRDHRHPARPAIVGIGASAGDVKALHTFFELLPDNPGAAFVVIVHLAPETRSELARILGAKTRMPVVQVQEPEQLEADHVYVIPPDRHLEITDNHVAAQAFTDRRGQRTPIDTFFRSLAGQHGDGFAIILTGAGSDGAIGLRAVKEAGGIILIQDPTEAEYGSMPRSAIATGLADFVLPLDALVKRLLELIGKKKQGFEPEEMRDHDEDYVGRILGHIRARTGHDFAQYKKSTLLRRIARRGQVTRREQLGDYYTYLRDNVEEVQALFDDLLISVTTFFRDPRAFEALAKQVVPPLFDDRDAQDPIRIWVPGCATGEEAYSIAILLLEEAAKRDLRPPMHVFASDLDLGALSVARQGLYPLTIQADVSEERLHRFFAHEGDHFRVRRELRGIVLFASHSVLKDPPFSRLDLISCRNLLIYLDCDLQQQICRIFHYALKPNGYLFLGASENADAPSSLFRIIDRDARIYCSAGRRADRPLPLPQRFYGGELVVPRTSVPRSPAHTEVALHRLALEREAPPSILVDELHRAVHLSETAGRYMQPSGGAMTADVTELVRPEMRSDLRAALHQAFEKGGQTLSLPILVRFNGQPHRVYLQVRPVPRESEANLRYALVMFIEGEATDAGHGLLPDRLGDEPATAETIRQLSEELQQTRAQLRATREESEMTNEELRAANEELQSINEEYRSTSEELETSKEELQSVNEELQTVNNELKMKLEAVSRAHSDIENLMAASDYATLFLDPTSTIKWFTPKISSLFNITATDEGRLITDFTHNLDYDGLSADVASVIASLTPLEREIRSRSGEWYLVRLRPYRTINDRIDGVVVTFIDVTELREAVEALRRSEERLRQQTRLVELSGEPIFVWDLDDGILEWNRGSEWLYGYSRDEALGQEAIRLLATSFVGTSFEDMKRHLLRTGSWTGEVVQTTKSGRRIPAETRIEVLVMDGRRLVLDNARDLTERKNWEKRQQLLLNELSHRVKNTLTVVQSMARQTLRTSASGEDFVERFEGRLAALASAHKLLVASDWAGAELGAMAREQLEPYAPPDRSRLRIEGDAVVLPADLATPFGLVLHELATNASKHGALSTAQGTLTLTWAARAEEDRSIISVNWREQNGPEVAYPKHVGFGRRLIEQGLPGASVSHEFRPAGVICSIELPITKAGQPDEREVT